MRDILAFLGVVLLGLVIWFFADFPSFVRTMTSAHHAQLQREIHNEVDNPQKIQINGIDYLIIPTK